MGKIYISLLMMLITAISQGQTPDSTQTKNQKAPQKPISQGNNLSIGGYGEVHYNQPLDKVKLRNGELDVHRLVMLLGYNFNSHTRFITEIEFEHISEVSVEQAYLQYKINPFIQFRGGLLLIPMGIINETHEPTTFNGVERPLIDQKISPATWREIGFGFGGTILPVKMKYQVYMVNGFNGFDGTARLNGKDGLRNGRQKGAESFISSPNIAAKTEYFGIRGLSISLSGYFGKTQSTLYDGINKKDVAAMAKADSSVVGVSMLGFDARYSLGGFSGRAQLYHTGLSNTIQYNAFTSVNGITNNLGSSMRGFYVEAGYNVFRPLEKVKTELIPFLRYEGYNTQQKVEGGLVKNKLYENTIITSGVSLKPASGAVLKADIRFLKSAAEDVFEMQFNAGIAVMF